MTAMFTNPAPQAIADLLRRVRTVAVVGLSPNESRPSHRVARGMQRFGWRIVPVRPAVTYQVLKRTQIRRDLADGAWVEAGDLLTDGSAFPSDQKFAAHIPIRCQKTTVDGRSHLHLPAQKYWARILWGKVSGKRYWK